jgi:TRAP-type C4-dicarboxylate transport system permease small subunit
MTQVLVRGTEERTEQRTEYRAPTPVRRRTPVVGYTLAAIGLAALIVGAYFQFAPSNWWLADLSEAYYLGSYTFGGLLIGVGSGVVARQAYVDDAGTSTRMISATVLAVAGLAGAVIAGFALLQAPGDTVSLEDVAGSDRHLAAQAAAADRAEIAGADRHLAAQAAAADRAEFDQLMAQAAGSDRHLVNQALMLDATAP